MMKFLINKLKQRLGLADDGPVTDQVVVPQVQEPVSFMPATPARRDAIIKFIIQSLRPYVDERSLSVAGLRFYILCTDAEQEEAARIALYADKPGLFKTEQLERKLLNHFIQLEPNWFFEYYLVKDQLPENCIQQGAFGLKITRAGDQLVEHYSTACLQVLVGQAEQFEYTLDPHQQLRFNIGRSKSPQLASGKIQLNDIVFLAAGEPGYDETAGRANLHVSRNHAYIVYDPKGDKFLLYPDKGGLPDSGNKIKVHTADDKIKWLNMYGIAHHLQEGDQIELGGEAILRFKANRG